MESVQVIDDNNPGYQASRLTRRSIFVLFGDGQQGNSELHDVVFQDGRLERDCRVARCFRVKSGLVWLCVFLANSRVTTEEQGCFVMYEAEKECLRRR